MRLGTSHCQLGALARRIGIASSVLVLGVTAHACSLGVFTCATPEDCVDGGIAGVCRDNGACSFPDADCPSGQRYANHSPGALAGECVPVDDASGSGTDGESGESATSGASSTTDPVAACMADSDCDGKICGPSAMCQDGAEGEPCSGSDHCELGLYCVSSTCTLGDCDTITDVDVTVTITHSWLGDLTIKLISPEGTMVTLVSFAGIGEAADDGVIDPDNDGDSSDLAGPVTYDDGAAKSSELMGDNLEEEARVCVDDDICDFYSSGFPDTEYNLTTLNGEAASGTWQLCFGDAVEFDVGIVSNWQLDIECASGTALGDSGTISLSPADDAYDGTLGSMECGSVVIN